MAPRTATAVELAATLDRLRDSEDPDGQVLEVDIAVRACVKIGRFDR